MSLRATSAASDDDDDTSASTSRPRRSSWGPFHLPGWLTARRRHAALADDEDDDERDGGALRAVNQDTVDCVVSSSSDDSEPGPIAAAGGADDTLQAPPSLMTVHHPRRGSDILASSLERMPSRRRRTGRKKKESASQALERVGLLGGSDRDSNGTLSPPPPPPTADSKHAPEASTSHQLTEGDDVGSDVEGTAKPLDPAPAALTTRWQRTSTQVSIIVERASLRSGRSTFTHISAVFDPSKLHVAFTPTPGHCELLHKALTGAAVVDDGSVLANGLPTTVPQVGRCIGEVPEFDAALANATVAENVTLAARMRLCRRYGIDDVVTDALTLLGLASFRHDIAGRATRLVRLLLNVAMEIVAEPVALVLLDPLLRLSGHEQVEATEVLNRVARALRIPVILVVTDVPYSVSAKASGTLLAVGDTGTMLYSGPMRRAGDFFDAVARLAGTTPRTVRIGSHSARHSPTARNSGTSPVPPPPMTFPMDDASTGTASVTVDPMEHLPSVVAPEANTSAVTSSLNDAVIALGDVVSGCRRHGTTAAVAAAFERHSQSVELRAHIMRESDAASRRADFITIHSAAAFSPDAQRRCCSGLVRCCSRHCGCRPWCTRDEWRVGAARFTVRVTALVEYGVLEQWRRVDQVGAWLALWAYFNLSAILSARQGGDEYGMMNQRGIVFFLLSCAMHVNGLFVAEDVAHRNAMAHLRRRQLYAPLSCWLATLARIALPRVAMAVSAYVAAKAYLHEALGLAVLVGLTSCAHALALAVWVVWLPDVRVASIALGVYYAIAVFFSGFIITVSTWPSWLYRASLLRPAYGGAVGHIMRGRPLACDAVRANQTMSYCFSGDQYLLEMGLADDDTSSGTFSLGLIVAGLSLLLLVSVIAR
jgi:ABC-type multidrug transport system ATPase subunit